MMEEERLDGYLAFIKAVSYTHLLAYQGTEE